MAIFIGKFFIADYIPCSLTADAMKANCMPRMSVLHTFLYCSRHSQREKKFSKEDGRGYCLSEKKNRTQK
jgi:hypothetical protein